MRRMWLAVAAAVVVGSVAACGGSDEGGVGGGEDNGMPPGTRSCSAWAGQMDESERWAAAEELLMNAKSMDGTEGDLQPTTETIRRFAEDLGALCEQKPSDELMAVVADELYKGGFYM